MSQKLWVSGRPMEVGGWDILGVFSTEAAAVARCTQVFDFVGPINLDEPAPEESVQWPGAYVPALLPESDE